MHPPNGYRGASPPVLVLQPAPGGGKADERRRREAILLGGTSSAGREGQLSGPKRSSIDAGHSRPRQLRHLLPFDPQDPVTRCSLTLLSGFAPGGRIALETIGDAEHFSRWIASPDTSGKSCIPRTRVSHSRRAWPRALRLASQRPAAWRRPADERGRHRRGRLARDAGQDQGEAAHRG